MKVYDLSQTLVHNMYVWPEDPPVLFEPFLTYEKDGANATFLKIGAHSGTNADAPLGYSVDGQDIADFPLTKWVGYATVLDIPKRPKEIIRPNEVQAGLSAVKGEIVIVATGWERQWGSEAYFTDYPRFAPEVVGVLTDHNIKMIGFDLPTPDPPEGEHPFHKKAFSNGIGILESLCNLRTLINQEFLLVAAPLKMKGVEASPVRAIGIVL